MMHSFPVPSPREPAPDVVRVIRGIEETRNPLGLYWSPDSIRWQVLMQDRSPARMAEGRKMGFSIDRLDGSISETLRRAHLMRDGWSLIKEYREADYNSPSWMRDDLAYLLGRSEKTVFDEFLIGLDISDGIPREHRKIEIWQDWRATDGRLVERVFQKGRTAMSFPSRAASLVRRVLNRKTAA